MILSATKSLLKQSFPKKRDIVSTMVSMAEYRSSFTKEKNAFSNLALCHKDIKGEIQHNNYLEYLETCWANHYSPVVKPDDIWYCLLCELSLLVAANPSAYRDLFTESSEKQEILVITNDPVVMPLDTLVGALSRKIPTEVDIFFPKFSTLTKKSTFAQYAAFADMCSPYYNYSMMLCGFPYIDVRGEAEDWANLLRGWLRLSHIFKKEKAYFQRVEDILLDASAAFQRKDNEFWAGIFGDKRCGSGGQTEIYGWFSRLFYKQPSTKYVSNYSTHLSKVRYKNISTNKQFEMYYGNLSSNIVGDKLEPQYGSFVFEVKENE